MKIVFSAQVTRLILFMRVGKLRFQRTFLQDPEAILLSAVVIGTERLLRGLAGRLKSCSKT
jgi:hypothetical protein